MSENSTTAVTFPGQGSQEKGMGRDLAEADSAVMEIWKLAEKACGAPLREIYWDGEEKDMAETRHLQPAMTVVNLSVWLRLAGKVSPMAVAGHSLGEFAALAAAGVLDIPAVLDLVTLRGRLMAEAGTGQDGRMAAVLKLDQPTVEAVVAEAKSATGLELRIANYNSPAQLVISGQGAAVEAALNLVKERKGRGVPLAVSGAFHSPLMAEAAAEFSKYLDRFDWRDAKVPVWPNADAKPESSGAALRERVRVQMTSSVLWTQTILSMWETGARRFVEPGPKGVLTRLAGAILAGREGLETVSVPGLEAAEALAC